MISIEEYVKIRKEELRKIFDWLKERTNNKITLHIFRLGNDQASEAYIRGKAKDGEDLGVKVCVHHQPNLDYDSVKNFSIDYYRTCRDIVKEGKEYGGVIIQLPLPSNIDVFMSTEVPEIIDVDGFNKHSYVNPCTPQGIINYLDYNKVDFNNKNVVILGRSNIVGKPAARLFLDRNSNVTILHSHTSLENKKEYVKNADIIISAVGKRNVLNSKDFEFKSSAIVIDVGINRDDTGKLCGDCERNLSVAFQTPVPRGVGLLTRIQLYDNLAVLIKEQLDSSFSIIQEDWTDIERIN